MERIHNVFKWLTGLSFGLAMGCIVAAVLMLMVPIALGHAAPEFPFRVVALSLCLAMVSGICLIVVVLTVR